MSVENPGNLYQTKLSIFGAVLEDGTRTLETGNIARYNDRITANEGNAILFDGARILNRENLFPRLGSYIEEHATKLDQESLQTLSDQLRGRISLIERKTLVAQDRLNPHKLVELLTTGDEYESLLTKVQAIIDRKMFREAALNRIQNSLFPPANNLAIKTRPDGLAALATRLTNEKPAITIPQAQEMLQMHFYLLSQGKSEPAMEQIMAHLHAHFLETNRPDALATMKVNLEKEQLSTLCQNDGDLALIREENPDYFNSLMEDYHSNLATKLAAGPSITSHPRDLYSAIDLEILKKSQGLYAPAEDGRNHLGKVTELLKGSVDGIEAIIQEFGLENALIFAESIKAEGLQEEHHDIILLAKEAVLKMKLDERIGSVVRIEDLMTGLASSQLEKLTPDFIQNLQAILELSNTNSSEMDLALLRKAIETHDAVRYNPRVMIEGAGPTGLMLAMTQYAAGADVSLFEARDAQYSRKQIVRLDPKWVALLEYHLGTRFAATFESADALATKRADGFVEITTSDLETILHNRLSELISLVDAEKGKGLERITLHEIKHTVRPSKQDNSFSILAQNKSGSGEPFIRREFDILFAAGGKNSKTRDKYLPSYSPVTEGAEYGVCSWGNGRLEAREFNAFEDFRGVVKIDDEFKRNFTTKVQQRGWNADKKAFLGEIGLYASDKAAPFIPGSGVGLRRDFFQTRCFENKNVIYIGMELPEELQALFTYIKEQAEARGHTVAFSNSIVQGIQKSWFQTIMEHYGLDRTLDLTQEKIITPSMANFPVAQNRSSQAFSAMDNPYGRKALIMPAGDASSSPHFMRYSGLSGARENVLHAQEYTHSIAMETDQALAQDILSAKSERTSRFVIKRGEVFLKGLSEAEIIENRKDKTRSQLEEAVAKTADLPRSEQTPYKVEKISDHDYCVALYGERINIQITDQGKIRFQTAEERGIEVDSVNHLEITLGIDDHTNINYRLCSENLDLQRTALDEIANDPTLLAFSFDNLKALTEIAKNPDSPLKDEAIEAFRKVSPRLSPEELKRGARNSEASAEEILFSMLHVSDLAGMEASPTHTQLTRMLLEIVA